MAGEASSGLEARPFEDGDREAWDRLVEESRSCHFLFRRDYMEYHRDRFEDASLVVVDGDAPVALLPASRDGAVVVSHGGLTFGGLISSPRLTTRRTVEALEAVLDRLRRDGAGSLTYKAVPAIYHRVPAEEDLYALFLAGAALVRRDCSAALRPASRLPYTKGRRTAVRQGKGAGLAVSRDDAFAEFMALEADALARRHKVTPVHTPEEMQRLAARFPDNIKLFTARRGGELLGGVIVYETPMVAHAQYIAGSESGYSEHALDAVVDFLISEEYAAKPWFDFGISTTEEGRVLNEGLIRNKESFGARAIVHDVYRVELGARDEMG
ncbi:MAG TPA: GNAT family N-acetyltransferase [Solirubrobacterales bacterium]|nr:GNAT family N-acetyltransferase [Solirubrobacterales bacterium]